MSAPPVCSPRIVSCEISDVQEGRTLSAVDTHVAARALSAPPVVPVWMRFRESGRRAWARPWTLQRG